MRFIHLRRWLLAIVVILGISTIIAGESESWIPASLGGELPSTGVGTMASASAGIEGVVPIPARVATPAGFERGLRVKASLVVGPGTAPLAGVAARRSKRYRHQGCRLTLTRRAWSVRRRGPPLLLPLV